VRVSLGVSCGYVTGTSPESDERPAQQSDAVELVERRLLVRAKDVVLVKGICEASEGLCAMFAERGGDLVLAAPRSRARELDELVRDLETDFGATIVT
jgi:hypothetical protein